MSDDEVDGGLDLDEVWDAIGARDWETLRSTLREHGYVVEDVGDLLEQMLSEDETKP